MKTRKTYKVEFTEQCSIELKAIYYYISKNISNQIEAKRLMRKIEEYTESLIIEPTKYLRYKYEGIEKCYRKIIINNIVLYYRINKNKKTVYVSHICKI